MKANDIMTKSVVTCATDAPIRLIARRMSQYGCGILPVVSKEEDKSLVGVITDRDIVCRVIADGVDLKHASASLCMSYPVVTVTPHTPLCECIRIMRDNEIRRLIVVDELGKCLGVVSQIDVDRTLSKRGKRISSEATGI